MIGIKNAYKGLLSGLLSGVLWGIDTILIGIVLMQTPFTEMLFLAPFISTFLHDMFSSIWMFIYLIFTKKTSELRNSLKSKSAIFIVIAALCGGPIGMTGYFLAIKYIGASYTATISAIYPAIGAFFAYIFLKDKLKLKGILGLGTIITTMMFLGFTSVNIVNNLALGFAFALLCVFGWGLESVICAYGMKDDISPEIALQIRQTTSFIAYAVILIPILKGYGNVYMVFKSEVVILIAITALAGTISYLFYYTAISKIGATRAMALNISYSAWAIILGVFVGSPMNLVLCISCILIIFGSIITAGNPRELCNYKGIYSK